MNCRLLLASKRVATRQLLRNSIVRYTTGRIQHLEILDNALANVNKLGWTREAVVKAATDLRYSPMAHTVASDGPISLVSHFMDRALDETCIEVDDQLHEFEGNPSDCLRFICTTRLKQTLPYIRRWPEAAAILAQPQNVPTAMQHLGKLTSQMHYLVGDQSVRFDWYAKRSALAAVYLSTELYMCEDKSPNHQDTWRFLKDRFQEMESAKQNSDRMVAFGEQFGRNLYNILASRGFVSPQ